jgi:hypothetical protein
LENFAVAVGVMAVIVTIIGRHSKLYMEMVYINVPTNCIRNIVILQHGGGPKIWYYIREI